MVCWVVSLRLMKHVKIVSLTYMYWDMCCRSCMLNGSKKIFGKKCCNAGAQLKNINTEWRTSERESVFLSLSHIHTHRSGLVCELELLRSQIWSYPVGLTDKNSPQLCAAIWNFTVCFKHPWKHFFFHQRIMFWEFLRLDFAADLL